MNLTGDSRERSEPTMCARQSLGVLAGSVGNDPHLGTASRVRNLYEVMCDGHNGEAPFHLPNHPSR